MNQVRARVDEIVEDPATAEALKPWYRQFCKRPCFHDDYLPTFNRPNVTLVDTEGKGVERITETRRGRQRREYEVDCLIFATGFEVGTAYTRAPATRSRPRRRHAVGELGDGVAPCTASQPRLSQLLRAGLSGESSHMTLRPKQ
jgi:cation diffusion facilitator CzcD-associated flavoprotein CzcO